MALTLAACTYSAGHGYQWSNVPGGVTKAELDAIHRIAADFRGDFPLPEAVDAGVIVRGGLIAAYTIRNVPDWDFSGRASDYAAYALVPVEHAEKIDFTELLRDDFFTVPSKNPRSLIEYAGANSVKAPPTAAGRLLCRNRYEDLPGAAAGSVIANFAEKAPQWHFHLNANRNFDVTCAAWKMKNI